MSFQRHPPPLPLTRDFLSSRPGSTPCATLFSDLRRLSLARGVDGELDVRVGRVVDVGAHPALGGLLHGRENWPHLAAERSGKCAREGRQ